MTSANQAQTSYRRAAPKLVDRGTLLLDMARGTGRFEAAMAGILGAVGIGGGLIVVNALVEERTPLVDVPLHWWAAIALLVVMFAFWFHQVGDLLKRARRGWGQRARVWENGLELRIDGRS